MYKTNIFGRGTDWCIIRINSQFFMLLQVESELVDKLDILVQEGKVDSNYKQAIVAM